MDIEYLNYKITHPLVCEFFVALNSNRFNQKVPNSVFYIPDFLSTNEEQSLIEHVRRAPKPKWTYLGNRSLQVYGGYPCQQGMIPEVLPEWLQVFTKKLQLMNIFDGHLANQVLINCYEPGQGIMAHEDGPLYYPTVATINAGSHTVLNFYEKLNDQENSNFRDRYRFSLLLWPRSLSILKHEVYQKYLHEIEELDSDIISKESPIKIVNLDQINEMKKLGNGNILHLTRTTRYSFTIRFVPKCHKIDISKILFKK